MHQARGVGQRGFTLVELMVTVAIVAILAAIAVPSYSDYVLRSRITEATTGLQDARVKMEQYFLDNRTYSGTAVTTGWGTSTNCAFAGPGNATSKFTFNCTAAASTFSITAVGTDQMTGFTYTINESNTRTTPNTPATWGGDGATCWVLKKDGSC